jgi:hypothetical protein
MVDPIIKKLATLESITASSLFEEPVVLFLA